MAFPTAVGSPSYSGGYIPRLYATSLLIAFYTATVFGAIANTEYEGQVSKMGDTLRIRTLPEIIVHDFVKDQKLNYDQPDAGYIDLVIDKAKSWNLAFSDIDEKQIDIDYVKRWAEHASNYLKIAIDADILANIYADANTYNKGATAGKKSASFNMGVTGTPLALSKDTIIDSIVDAGTVLDEQDVPDENRWFILPSWATGMIKKSELKDASMTGDGQSLLRNGRLGMIDRFEIFRSNNLSSVTDGSYTATNALFGHKSAIAFASQITKVETLRNPDTFGDLMRSLQVYGYKATKSEALGHFYIRKAA